MATATMSRLAARPTSTGNSPSIPAPGASKSLATWGATGSHQDYLTATGNTDATCVCRMKGLYEVSPDRLRVVFDPTGRDYPQSFDIPPASTFTTFVFQREAK